MASTLSLQHPRPLGTDLHQPAKAFVRPNLPATILVAPSPGVLLHPSQSYSDVQTTESYLCQQREPQQNSMTTQQHHLQQRYYQPRVSPVEFSEPLQHCQFPLGNQSLNYSPHHQKTPMQQIESSSLQSSYLPQSEATNMKCLNLSKSNSTGTSSTVVRPPSVAQSYGLITTTSANLQPSGSSVNQNIQNPSQYGNSSNFAKDSSNFLSSTPSSSSLNVTMDHSFEGLESADNSMFGDLLDGDQDNMELEPLDLDWDTAFDLFSS
jgi:hypothetical protein